ncbi:MAG: alpha/beta hydrolase [Gammaproteobacteria bacterium]|nr:alpha/beta hydrolase [Gammaproteobacteria bacterium]
MLNNQQTSSTKGNATMAPPISTSKSRPVPTILKVIRFAFGTVGRIAPDLAGRAAYKLWFTPTRFKTPASEYAVLVSAKIESHRINDETIVTYSWGQTGPIVLLVHGWSGRGTQLGNFVDPLIKAGYRVLSFDAPAHGKSSGKQTNLYIVADVILALQKHYGTFDSVITHSFGGPCIAVALQRGLLASRVINISPPATTKGLVDKFISTLNIPEKAGLNLIERIETTFGKKIWHEISMKNTVRGLNIPALVIHDDQDTDVPWQEGQIVAQSWDNARFVKTTGLGHRRILRDTTVIESAVNFIAVAA